VLVGCANDPPIDGRRRNLRARCKIPGFKTPAPESAGGNGAVIHRRRASDSVALKDLRVLVVDDDPGTRDAVAEMLSATGAKVRVAESTTVAIREMEEFQPEVLLCDIAMHVSKPVDIDRLARAVQELAHRTT
jgi:PleD family two-component response regulator